jgi:hypothetical protein
MKRRLFLIFFFVGTLLLIQCVLSGQEAKKKVGMMQLELYIGHSQIDPADLNLFPDFYFMYNHQTGWRKYHYYMQTQDNYDVYRRDQGKFKKIANALPFGIRIKRFFGPNFALAVGFRFMARNATSVIHDKFEVSYLSPDYTPFYRQFTDERSYDPSKIGFTSYVLHVGNHHIFRLNRVWSGELFFALGVGYAACRYDDQITTNTTYSMEDSLNDYWQEQTYTTTFRGDGFTFFSELGFRMNIQWHPRISFFLEASANSLNFKNINGPGEYQETYKDSNAEGSEYQMQGKGRWRVQEVNFQNTWGYFSQLRTYIETGDSSNRAFALNLSGFQFRFGIGYRF